MLVAKQLTLLSRPTVNAALVKQNEREKGWITFVNVQWYGKSRYKNTPIHSFATKGKLYNPDHWVCTLVFVSNSLVQCLLLSPQASYRAGYSSVKQENKAMAVKKKII